MALNLKKRFQEQTSDDVTRKILIEEKSTNQRILNEAFYTFCKSVDPLSLWEDAAKDYEFYANRIQSRYDFGVSAQKGAKIYSFGCGDCGQLGHGISDPPKESEETSVAKPKMIRAFESSKDIRIMVSSGLINGVVDSKGLWTWGCNDGDALGRGDDENLPKLVNFPTKITVTCLSLGDSHGVCTSITGQAFIWGSYRDKEGKIFFPTTAVLGGMDKESPTGTTGKIPFEFKEPKNVVSCASGSNHTLLLTGEGSVYSLGLGEQNQLGRKVSTQFKIPEPEGSDNEPQYDLRMLHREHLKPGKVMLKDSVRTIGCGSYHCLVVSAIRFEVFGWGLNQYRQVGPEEKSMVDVTHLKGLDGKDICFVAGGEHFSIAKSLDGSLYSWGRSDNFQLGRNLTVNDDSAGSFEDKPGKVIMLPPVSNVACGSSHVVACSPEGSVYAWGFGDEYQLGNSSSDEKYPKKIESLSNVVNVSAGSQHTCVLIGETQN